MLRTWPRGKKLYRAGIPQNKNFVWFSTTPENAKRYANKAREYRLNFTIINYTPNKPIELLNLRRPNVYRMLNGYKQYMSLQNRAQFNAAIKLVNGKVTRSSYKNRDRVLAQLVKQLGYKGWIYNGGEDLYPEVLLIGNIPNLNRRYKNNPRYRKITKRNVVQLPKSPSPPKRERSPEPNSNNNSWKPQLKKKKKTFRGL